MKYKEIIKLAAAVVMRKEFSKQAGILDAIRERKESVEEIMPGIYEPDPAPADSTEVEPESGRAGWLDWLLPENDTEETE